mgnify:CR=1 FL=1
MRLNPVIAWFERFRLRLSRFHPDHFRIARAAFWVGLFTLSAKLIAAAKEMAMAWRYGLGPEVDAYNLALTWATWLPVVLAGIFAAVLVPALSRLNLHDSLQRHYFLQEINGLAALVSLVVTLLIGLFAFWGFPYFAWGLDQVTQDLAHQMLISLLPLVALTILIGLHVTLLQVGHDRAYPAAEGLPALAVVGFIFVLDGAEGLPLVAGVLIGTVAQYIWLMQRTRRQYGRIGFAWRFHSPEWGPLWRFAILVGLGQLVMSFATPLDQLYAARLGPGALATLGYCNRMIAIVLTLGALIVSRATLPVFAEGVASGQFDRIGGMAAKLALVLLLLGAVAALALGWFAPWIVALLFENGRFSPEDTQQVAHLFRYALFQVPFSFALVVLASLLVSARLNALNLWASMLFIVLKVVGLTLLVDWLGLEGVVLSTGIAYALSAFFIFIALHRRRTC